MKLKWDWRRVLTIICVIVVMLGIFSVPATSKVPPFIAECEKVAGKPQLIAEIGGRRMYVISHERMLEGGVERDDYFIYDEGGVIKGCRHIHWKSERGEIEVFEDKSWGEERMERFLLEVMKQERRIMVESGGGEKTAANLSYISKGYRGNFVIRVGAKDSDMCYLGSVSGSGCSSTYRSWYFVRLFPVIDPNSHEYAKVGFTVAASGDEWEYEFRRVIGKSPQLHLAEVSLMKGKIFFRTINNVAIDTIIREKSSPNATKVWKFIGAVNTAASLIGLKIGSLNIVAIEFLITQLTGWLINRNTLWGFSGSKAWLSIPGVGIQATNHYGDFANVSRCWLSPNASPNRSSGCYLDRQFFKGELTLLAAVCVDEPHGWRISYNGYVVVTTSDMTGYDQRVKWLPASFDVEVGSPQ